MAKVKWTEDQLSAIRLRPKKMLVSAAAGSGKTAVLSERIISRLTDPRSNADITKFLVVTYTRLAAAELRSRIGKKLREASVNTSGDISRRMARQCNRLGSAHISTIHSYCAALVKRHFRELELPPVLKVCEEAQAIELKERVMDELIELAYAGGFAPIPDFEAFAGNFVTAGDKKLAEKLLKLYQTVSGLPNGFRKWQEAADTLASPVPFLSTPWGELLAQEYCRKLRYYELNYARMREELLYSEKCDGYRKLVETELQKIQALYNAIKNRNAAEASAVLADLASHFADASLPTVRNSPETAEAREFFRPEIRDKFKKLYPVIAADPAFNVSPDGEDKDTKDLCALRAKSAEISHSLVAFLHEFDVRYKAEKRRLGILDFADLEQYTYTLLYGEDGEYSPLAHEVSASFDEIFVDEFQDINPMQSDIFRALSCECSIFQVGDIKQSIYGFRGAAPHIFSDYRRSYTALDRKDPETEKAETLTVFLSANFRSAFPVTAFVNRIFDPIFYTPEDYISVKDRIPYLPEADQLICRRKEAYEDEECTVLKKGQPPVEMTLIEVPPKPRGKNAQASFDPEKLSTVEAECIAVSRKITSLIKSGVKGQDIAIVARGASHVALIEEQLLRENITLGSDKGAHLADMPEVQLALSILSCVDNPHKDVPLAGALRSPLFGFSFDELITVRRHKKDVSLFSALQSYTEENGFEKGQSFIDFIDRIRKCSAGQPASHVLWQIYTEKDFFSAVYDGGKASPVLAAARRANLVKLHSLASESETVGRDGIYTFLRRFERISATNNAPTATGAKDENTVKFFTTHGSKGLEFPHCFVCGLGHSPQKSQQRDTTSDAVCDTELGIAVKLRDATSIAKTDTPVRKAIEAKMKYTQFEEELRILYVALTRAKDHLYVTATTENYAKLMQKIKNAAALKDPSAYPMLSTPLEWVMTALHTERNGGVLLPPELLRIEVLTEAQIRDFKGKKNPTNNGNREDNENKLPRDEELYQKLKARLEAEYAYKLTATLPAKVSVSHLYPTLLDDNNDPSDPVYARVREDQMEACEKQDVTVSETEENAELTAPKTDITDVKTDGENAKKTPLRKPLFSIGARLTGIRDKIAEENEPDTDESASELIHSALKYNTLDTATLSSSAVGLSPAEKGTATHLFMQFCDLENVEKHGVDAEVDRLVQKQFILPYHAAIMDRELIKRFMASRTYSEIKKARRVRREVRFNTRLPASTFTQNETKARELENETILVQGVIDCYYVTEDGKTVLLDYKTDAFPEGMSESAIAATLRKRHMRQLYYYKLALERLLLKPIDRVEIYSFALGKTVSLRFKR